MPAYPEGLAAAPAACISRERRRVLTLGLWNDSGMGRGECGEQIEKGFARICEYPDSLDLYNKRLGAQ